MMNIPISRPRLCVRLNSIRYVSEVVTGRRCSPLLYPGYTYRFTSIFFFFSSFLEAKNVATISPLKEDLTQGVYIYMLFHLSSSPQSRSLAWVPLYG